MVLIIISLSDFLRGGGLSGFCRCFCGLIVVIFFEYGLGLCCFFMITTIKRIRVMMFFNILCVMVIFLAKVFSMGFGRFSFFVCLSVFRILLFWLSGIALNTASLVLIGVPRLTHTPPVVAPIVQRVGCREIDQITRTPLHSFREVLCMRSGTILREGAHFAAT